MKTISTFLSTIMVLFLFTVKIEAKIFACGDNSYNPVAGAFSPLDFDTYKFKDGGRYVLVYHVDSLGSYVLAPNGGVGAGVDLVLKLYVAGDKSMEFIMEDAGDGAFFLRSSVDQSFVVTGGGNMTVPKLQKFENVTNISEQMFTMAYCGQSEMKGLDCFTLFNVYFGAAIESNNQNVYQNAPLLGWKNYGAFHPVNLDSPDYTFKGIPQISRPTNSTFNPETPNQTKNYAIIYSKNMTFQNNIVKGMGLKVNDTGAILSDYTGTNEFLYNVKKVGDALQFINVANGKILTSDGTNMSAVKLSSEGSIDNSTKGLWTVKDIADQKYYGLAFMFSNKFGVGGFVPNNYSATEGNGVIIWADGDKWYVFDAAMTKNPFVKETTTGFNNIEPQNNIGTVSLSENYLSVKVPGSARIIITSLSGQVSIDSPLSSDTNEISTSNLTKGIYIVRIYSKDYKLLNTTKIPVY